MKISIIPAFFLLAIACAGSDPSDSGSDSADTGDTGDTGDTSEDTDTETDDVCSGPNTTTETFGDSGSGTFDKLLSSETHSYNAAQLLTASVKDNDGDGVVDYRVDYTLDAEGRVLVGDIDNDGGGTVDYRYVYTYDASGNPTRLEVDTDNDGSFDRVEVKEFDASGNVTLFEKDTDGDQTVDYRETNTYSSGGDLTSQAVDSNADGTPEYTLTWTHNSEGHLIEQVDQHGYTDTMTYDSNGCLLTLSSVNSQGVQFESREYTCNADGLPTAMEETYSGHTFLTRVESWTYNAAAQLTRHVLDLSGSSNQAVDGVPDRIENLEYDARGNLTMDERLGQNNELLNRYTHTFSDEDLTTTTRFETDSSSQSEWTESYVYDTNETLIEMSYDHGSDGTINRVTHYGYLCD